MNKNTGDGELDDLHKWLEQSFAGFMATDPRTHTRASTQMAADYAMKRIEAVIRSELAQETNKAQQQLLQGLMEEFQEARTWEDKSQRHAAGIFLDNDDQVIGYNEAISHGKSAIQNKLEGLS